MARPSIGATLALNAGNFFTNLRSATSNLNGLQRSTISATSTLKKLGGVAATVGKSFLAVSTAGITAMTGLTVKALDMAGELEQNLGGSEAVFKDYAKGMQDIGETAFSTMGLSKSDFLATANKMGALFQGAGFSMVDSADYTADAMQRAADVASIMGLEVDAAMEAVAGAAKGNFTMMDNLGVAMNDTSIGIYAASKGIKKATKDMTQQEKICLAMDMFFDKTAYAAGNYAKENDTLAGSLTTAKAAFATFMSGAGSAEGISNAFVNVVSVVSKKVSEILPTLTTGLSQIIKQLAPKIPELLKSALPGITAGAMSLVEGLADVIPMVIGAIADSIPTVLPVLVSGFSGVISKLATAITANAPLLLSGIGEGIKSALAETDLSGVGMVLGDALGGLGDALNTTLDIAKNVYDFFVNNWSLIEPVIVGITGAVLAYKAAVVICNVVEAISAIARTGLVGATAAEITALGLSSGAMGIYSTVTGIATTVTGVFGAVLTFVTSPIGIVVLAIGALIAVGILLWKNWDKICSWISSIWEGIKQTAINVWNAVSEFLTGVWNGIADVVMPIWNNIISFFSSIWSSISGTVSTVWEGIKGFLIGAWNSISDTATNVFNGVKTIILNIWDGIVGGIKGAVNMILGAINGLIRGFVSGINGLIKGVNTVTGAIGIPSIPTFNAPQIPMLAKGGNIITSGRVLVGEKGPEYLDLPKGARVTPLNRSNASGNPITINIYADGKSVDTIVNELVPKLKLAMSVL